MKRRPPPTTPHAKYDAPRVVTHRTDDCTAPECVRGDWSGENLYSGGDARCCPTPHWDAIVAVSEKTGLPRAYRRDLYVHDRAHLAQLDPAEPFLWVLRESGTHLVPLSYFDGVGHGAVHFATSIPKIFGSDNELRIYTWDGSHLREHRWPETAADALREMRAS